MHYDDWNGGWGAGGLLLMAFIMLVFWGGLAWVVVSLLRRPRPPAPSTDHPLSQQAPTAKALLDERLARGDIEVDDYRERLDALAAGTDDR